MNDESIEVEPDEPIKMLGDRRSNGGAADIGGEHFGEQKRIGQDVSLLVAVSPAPPKAPS